MKRVVIYAPDGVCHLEDFEIAAADGIEILFVPGKDLPVEAVETRPLDPEDRAVTAGERIA